MTARELVRAVATALPAGSTLPEDSLRRRHTAILILLWLHLPVLAIFGMLTGHGALHSFGETAAIAVLAAGASVTGLSFRARSSLATVGLIACSAILVHFSGGLIEMHFHFFVMVAVVTLYQSWLPFLLAITFVVLHHGIGGVLDPSSVYNHAEAISNPWRWAFIHGLFISGASAAGLTAWKLNEIVLERAQEARKDLEEANVNLASAQSLSQVGNWKWDIVQDRVSWSDELFRIAGVDPAGFDGTHESFLARVHPDDRGRVQAIIERACKTCSTFNYRARLVRPDGEIRTIDALGKVEGETAGLAVKMIGTVQDITERTLLEEKIEYQAFHDPLTDLANRALFLDRIDHALRRQRRSDSPLAVVFMDLDDFKTVNDSLGHRAGDILLVELARRVEASLGPSDTIARLGGDEFAILLEDIAQLEDAVMVVQRILDVIKDPFTIEGTEFFVQSSIGIAYVPGDEPKATGHVLRDADTAMYAAKRSGKATYEVFAPEMQSAAKERLSLMADLQRAIDNEEFFLHYQPLIDLRTGRVIGVEALVRWQHPERGVVYPGDFIPYAEESGLILPLGRWVLLEAASQAAEWLRDYPSDDPFTMSVNISGVRLRHAELGEELATVLRKTGLDPARLVLEITESVLVEDSERDTGRLAEVRALGVNLAIDDFGTGYSSLSYLRDFPVDVLKIDKAFIDSIAVSPEDSAPARAIVKLGEALGLKVVAEGVESEEQASVLRGLACPYAQGYLFSRPVEGRSIEEMLALQCSESPTLYPESFPPAEMEPTA